MTQLIALNAITNNSIPYFAMAAEKGVADTVTTLQPSDISNLLSKKHIEWLRLNASDRFKIISTRHVINERSAIYGVWICVFDESLADLFLKNFPKLNIDNRISGLQSELDALSNRAVERLNHPGMVLSQYSPLKAIDVSKQFIQQFEKINEYNQKISDWDDTRKMALIIAEKI